jgi:hypothetical protein
MFHHQEYSIVDRFCVYRVIHPSEAGSLAYFTSRLTNRCSQQPLPLQFWDGMEDSRLPGFGGALFPAAVAELDTLGHIART